MSRVHDALRRAEATGQPLNAPMTGSATMALPQSQSSETSALQGLLSQVKEIPWEPAPDAHHDSLGRGFV